ncbi:hypothetical protein BD289DRAFT_444767 [Coniella lustricola]|uniref:Uncharacterized protein n=1 Tax=Coniella lustricola TaxID=2025994 RepID=A0A2T2ZVM2_9PEZI|nr:hypothetical protein BD289DRAFT_444767 [Coniella lustricola]
MGCPVDYTKDFEAGGSVGLHSGFGLGDTKPATQRLTCRHVVDHARQQSRANGTESSTLVCRITQDQFSTDAALSGCLQDVGDQPTRLYHRGYKDNSRTQSGQDRVEIKVCSSWTSSTRCGKHNIKLTNITSTSVKCLTESEVEELDRLNQRVD